MSMGDAHVLSRRMWQAPTTACAFALAAAFDRLVGNHFLLQKQVG